MDDLYVDDAKTLAELCVRLGDSSWIALDTEFVRETTYFPKPCLIQVANDEQLACIDPIALDDLEPFFDLLYDPNITKVLHAAHQDLEIFFNLRGSVPHPVFDTQIAATLLGYGEQVGYASLVNALCDVVLDKSYTRTDWRQRPLGTARIRYALDDVRYLRQIYRRQHTELQRQQRLTWLAEDFHNLCDRSRYELQPSEAWKRIKAGRQLKGAQLTALHRLAAWREQLARTIDRPRRWVLGDRTLLQLARQMPREMEDLRRIQGLESNIVECHGEKLLELITAARNEIPATRPDAPQYTPLTPEQEALVDAMMAVVRMRAAALALNPQTLVSRKDLESLVGTGADIRLLHGWRAVVAGHEVAALLQGRSRLELYAGELRTIPVN